jgi:DNA processing protein
VSATAGGGHRVPDWVDDDRLARAAWSRVVEPTDRVGARVADRVGPARALRHVAAGVPLPVGAGTAEVDPDGDAGTRVDRARVVAALAEAAERWRVRLAHTDPRRDLDAVLALGGRLVVPGDPDWPPGLDDLRERRPACLWVRGGGDLRTGRSVALVGSRAVSAYGRHVAGDLAAGAVRHGLAVVSGGAFGVDAAAHQGALAAEGRTVCVLACGVDRAYPRAHERLLAQVCVDGLVVSESPPGADPTRWRFLERNRLIAALSGATVVVEAAWRSGALSTARHAVRLGRPLGAVPGPVTSAGSAGCHRLLREDGAVCVTTADEVVELASAVGEFYPARPVAAPAPHDDLQGTDLQVYEALAPRRRCTVAQLAVAAGAAPAAVLAALGRLELLALAVRDHDDEGRQVWRRGRGRTG